MKVRTETVGRVRVVTIDRPEVRNAVDAETAEALEAAFDDFDNDERVEVAVLHGAGGTFCAGADLTAITSGMASRVKPEGPGPMGPTRMTLSKPAIAAVEGHAVAGGLELAIWCDLRVAGEGAVFGVFCRRFGVPLVDGGTVRLPRLIGESRALDMILTGRPVPAPEALEIGLVNRVVPDGSALEAASALAEEIASHPATCMRNDRISAIGQWSLDEASALRRETELGLETVASGEPATGAEAFGRGHGRHGRGLGQP